MLLLFPLRIEFRITVSRLQDQIAKLHFNDCASEKNMMSELGKKGSEKRGVGLGSTQNFALRSLWSTDPRESRASKRMTESTIGY